MSDSAPDVANEDPRIERTRRAVRVATLEVLAERGYAGFSIEAVAERARVAKSTIYRHWPDRIGLITDAAQALNRQPRVLDEEGTARERVERLLVHLTEVFADTLLSSCMPALVEAAQHHPEVATLVHAYSAGRRQTLVDVLAAGVASGELPPHVDPEIAALALSSPIILCRMLTPEPFPTSRVPVLAEQVLGPARTRRRQSKR